MSLGFALTLVSRFIITKKCTNVAVNWQEGSRSAAHQAEQRDSRAHAGSTHLAESPAAHSCPLGPSHWPWATTSALRGGQASGRAWRLALGALARCEASVLPPALHHDLRRACRYLLQKHGARLLCFLPPSWSRQWAFYFLLSYLKAGGLSSKQRETFSGKMSQKL